MRRAPTRAAEAVLAEAWFRTITGRSSGEIVRGGARRRLLARRGLASGEATRSRTSLTGAPGDPARGRAIVASRQVGLCLLCHSGPFPEERFQGNLAPDLRAPAPAGRRASSGCGSSTPAEINPATIMPAYHRTEGLTRVAPALRGKPVLSAQQIEDVVAFLMTLKD